MKNTNKNLYLILILLGCLVEIQGCDESLQKGCTDPASFNYDPVAQVDDGSCQEMAGCLGYSSGYSNSGSKGTTLDNPLWDQKMNAEVGIQRNFFNGIPAIVWILNEPGPNEANSYADPRGEILMGYHHFYQIVSQYGELPVAGVLAHEWGHRCQQHLGWTNSFSQRFHIELEADAFSGYYMALAKQYAWSQIESYFRNTYAGGDNNFNSPSHHGTKEQRLLSAYLGVQTAIDVLNSGVPLSYDELHTFFKNEIETNIAGKREVTFEEVAYPPNLSPEYVESLFPIL